VATPNISNIFKSGAALWYAPEGTSIPSKDSVAAGASWGGSWSRLGFTKAPLATNYAFETAMIDVEEVLASVDIYKIAESIELETELAELTPTYLNLTTGAYETVGSAAAGSGTVGYDSVTIGDESRIDKVAIGFEGIRYDPNDNALPYRFFIYRAVMILNGAMEFSRKSDSYPGLPLRIVGLADTANGNRLYHAERVTAPAN
jgi:hypothetical protein